MSPWLDSELEPRELRKLTKHLEKCEACRKHFSRESKLVNNIEDVMRYAENTDTELGKVIRETLDPVTMGLATTPAGPQPPGAAGTASSASAPTASPAVPPTPFTTARPRPRMPSRATAIVLGMLLVGGLAAGVGALRSHSDRGGAATVEQPSGGAHPMAKPRPERVPLRLPGRDAEAFATYERALSSLEINKVEERDLATWARDAAKKPGEAMRSLVRKNLRALALLREGVDARRCAPCVFKKELRERALALGRLHLVVGAFDFESGLASAACERAADVARFADDLERLRESEMLGAALENETARALAAWSGEKLTTSGGAPKAFEQFALLAPPGDDVSSRAAQKAQERLARVLSQTVALQGKEELK